jgi:hypothetical protein
MLPARPQPQAAGRAPGLAARRREGREAVATGRRTTTADTAVEDKVHLHDLHATILHLIGLDHEKLTYRYAGRDFRLMDVVGRVVREILA